MKRTLWVLPVLGAALVWRLLAAYSYYHSEDLYPANWSYWTPVDGAAAGYYSGGYGGLYTGALLTSAPYSDSEVRIVLRTNTYCTCSVSTYHRVSPGSDPGAGIGGQPSGTMYWINIAANWSGGITVNRVDNGIITQVGYGIAAVHDGSVIRSIVRTDPVSGYPEGVVYVDNIRVPGTEFIDTDPIPAGLTGIGAASTTASAVISHVDLGHIDTVAPTAIPAGSIGVSPFYTNHVDLSWPATADDANGTGLYGYEIWRNGVMVGSTNATTTTFSDSAGIVPDTTYNYVLKAVDYHLSAAPTAFTATTPKIPYPGPYPSNIPEGRQVGVRPTGTYWGAGGENVDVRSGNVNYTMPLIAAKGRGGSGVNLNLTYNSQNWRQDSGSSWKFSGDAGYGFGWRLQAGSITPFVGDPFTGISDYQFTDSTGAEYRLDQNNGNVWSSKQSIYVWFDANTNILHFRDGSFWYFGCISGTGEADAGVMYPTMMEDTNGNQILLTYQQSASANWNNSSSRITQIEDVRAVSLSGVYSTYNFAYNNDAVPHLTTITNTISAGEAYTLAYVSQTVCSPISGQSCATTAMLDHVTVTNNSATNAFQYGTGGELTRVTFPYGGYLSYDYQTVNYPNSHSYREVAHRYLSKDGSTTTTYTFYHESPITTDTHQYTLIDDTGAGSEKGWSFTTAGGTAGLPGFYAGRQGLNGSTTDKVQNGFNWQMDAAGNSYLGWAQTTMDPGPNQAVSLTTQTLDSYGNVTQVNKYNYGNLSTPYRTTNYYYLNSSAYTSRYIFNRLSYSALTDGSNTTYPASLTYDGSGLTSVNGTAREWDSGVQSVAARGNITTSVVPDTRTDLTYDVLGNVASSRVNYGTASNATTTSATNFAAPSQITTGQFTNTMNFNSFLGLTNETGPNNYSISLGYDIMAHPASVTSPFGAVTNIGYDAGGSPVSKSIDGRWTSTSEDGLGRPLVIQTGYGSTTVSQQEMVYGPCGCSPLGKMVKQAVPHAPNTTPAYTTYTYDAIGRTVSVQAADSASTTTYAYVGNTVKVTDPAGNWKKYATDVLGQLVQVNEPNPAGGGGGGGGGGSTPALVQHTYAHAPSPMGVSFASNVTTGNLILVAVSADVDTSTVSTITDNRGNPYTRILQGFRGTTGDVTGELWYAKNVTGGTVTVTVTMTGANYHFVDISEFSGLDPTSPLDQSTMNSNIAAPTWSSGFKTTTSATELIIGFKLGGNYPGTAGSGFSLIDVSEWTTDWAEEYKVVTSAGSYDAEFPDTQNIYGMVMMATFKAAGSGGGGGGSITLVQHPTPIHALSPMNIAFSTAVTTGNLILVAVSADVDTSTVSTITDNRGNPYTRILQGFRGMTGDVTGELWYAKNVTGGTVTVTVTMTGANYHFVDISEFSGLDPTSPLDQSAMNSNIAAPTWSSGFKTTTSANELIIGFKLGGVYPGTPGSGFSLIDIGEWSTVWAEEYKVVTSTGSYDAEFPDTQNIYGMVMMATFKAAGSGGGGGGGADYVTTYTYDLLGNLNGVSMPRPTGTQTRSFTYAGHLLMSATNPENGTVSYTYNTYQKIASKTDQKGQQTLYSYDSYTRLSKVQHLIGGSEDLCQQVNYSYDSNPYDNVFFSNNISGRLAAVQYKNATTTSGVCDTTFQEWYSYDDGMTHKGGARTKKRLRVIRNGVVTATDLDGSYTYDTEGRMTGQNYPTSWTRDTSGNPTISVTGANLTYGYDSMGRLNTLTENGSNGVISSTSYGPAGNLTGMSGLWGTESRSYNAMLQMTGLSSGPSPGTGVSILYNYSPNQNNGKIVSEHDTLSGEQVTYTYDSLNRLAHAVGSGWDLTYGYDGFGNLTDQSGTPYNIHTLYDATTNRVSGECSDLNGNIGGCTPNPSYSYDVENRIMANGPLMTVQYGYAPDNKRVWRSTWSSGTRTLDEVTFWSVTGQRVGIYDLVLYGGSLRAVTGPANPGTGTEYYFGGKLIKNVGGYVHADRLGSVGKYYPYGQDRSAPANGTEKFGTYFRDADTGLDYAVNRYEAPGQGRFLSPDTFDGSSNARDPGSWNRYSYVGGDPVNRVDPFGKDWCDAIAFADGTSISDLETCGQTGWNVFSGLNLGALVSGVVQSAVQQACVAYASAYAGTQFAANCADLQTVGFNPGQALGDCVNAAKKTHQADFNAWAQTNPRPTWTAVPSLGNVAANSAAGIISWLLGGTAGAASGGVVISIALGTYGQYLDDLKQWLQAEDAAVEQKYFKAVNDCIDKWGPVRYPWAYPGYQYPPGAITM